MPAEIKACRTAIGYMIRVEGRGTLRESPAVREFAGRCLDQQRALTLLFDLSPCEYLDSTFLGCLVGVHRRVQDEPQLEMSVCADTDTLRRLLGATRLDKLFHCIESAPEPAGPWVPLSAPELQKHEFGQHVLECHQRLSELECPSAAAFKTVADQLARELAQSQPGR
jgi:anti-anti-sigma factor